MQNSLLNETVDIYRRIDEGRDVLGNPTYGDPVTGAGWNLVYQAVPVRLAFTANKLEFAIGGERVLPQGTMYASQNYVILSEDRVMTSLNVQYVVTATSIGYKSGAVIDHYEYKLDLP